MSQSQDAGLMSSAGLVRYFDSEDANAIRINPRTVIAVSVFLGIFVEILKLIT